MTTNKKVLRGKYFKEYQEPSESIYNLISNSPEIKKKSPRYQSIHSCSTKKFYSSGKKCHQTMGCMKTTICPCQFLRKNSRDKNLSVETVPFTCLKDCKRPPVPKSGEEPVALQEVCCKDFINLNRLNVIRRPALRPARKKVDNKRGDSFFLEFSGLVPKFSMKKNFGATPKYLVQRKIDLKFSDEVYKKSFEDSKLIKMTDEERNDLLEGLRDNWEELNKRYLSLPVMIDTKRLRSRKLELEQKLDSLEHDIYFLEKNKDNDIYVLPE